MYQASEPVTAKRIADPDIEVVRAATTDLSRFAPIYNQYAPAIYSYCLRRLGDRELAEDITSTVFTRAMQSLESYRDTGASFRAWLFTIAHHAIVDVQRESVRKPIVWLDERVVDSRPTPEEIALIADERERLAALLAMLPSDQRRVVELRLAGLSGEEIAAVLGRSHGSIRQLQFRAMRQLRLLIEPPSVPDSEQKR